MPADGDLASVPGSVSMNGGASSAAPAAQQQQQSEKNGTGAPLAADARPPRAPRPPRGPRAPDTPEIQLSKALSYILRHGAAKEMLPVRADGFISVDRILARPKIAKIKLGADGNGKGRAPTADDIRNAVASDRKGRFELRTDDEGVLVIRAVQGHSIQEVTSLDHNDLTLENLATLADGKADSSLPAGVLPPSVEVLHGTTHDAWNKIQASGGLSRMQRNHIHLAKGRPGAFGVISGMRASSPIILHIDIVSALRDGIPFHIASNGAVLTAGKGDTGVLPLAYIARAEDTKSGRTLYTRDARAESSADNS